VKYAGLFVGFRRWRQVALDQRLGSQELEGAGPAGEPVALETASIKRRDVVAVARRVVHQPSRDA
jgi:hypothetical protein